MRDNELLRFALEQYIAVNRRARLALVRALHQHLPYFADADLYKVATILGISKNPAIAEAVLNDLLEEAGKPKVFRSEKEPPPQPTEGVDETASKTAPSPIPAENDSGIPDSVIQELRVLVQQLLGTRDVLAYALKKTRPNILIIDWSDCFLIEVDFTGFNLAEIELENTYLQGANLLQAIVVPAKLAKARTAGASISGEEVKKTISHLGLEVALRPSEPISLEEEPLLTSSPLPQPGAKSRSREIGQPQGLLERSQRPLLPSRMILRLYRAVGQLDLSESQKKTIFEILERISEQWEQSGSYEEVIENLKKLYDEISMLYKQGAISLIDWTRIRRYYNGTVIEFIRRNNHAVEEDKDT